MQVWANDVRSGDPDNLDARAAVYYWKSLFGHIAGLCITDKQFGNIEVFYGTRPQHSNAPGQQLELF